MDRAVNVVVVKEPNARDARGFDPLKFLNSPPSKWKGSSGTKSDSQGVRSGEAVARTHAGFRDELESVINNIPRPFGWVEGQVIKWNYLVL